MTAFWGEKQQWQGGEKKEFIYHDVDVLLLWHPTWVKVPLMFLGRRHQCHQDCEHSDRKQPQGRQGHDSSNAPGYLSGDTLTTTGIPVAETERYKSVRILACALWNYKAFHFQVYTLNIYSCRCNFCLLCTHIQHRHQYLNSPQSNPLSPRHAARLIRLFLGVLHAQLRLDPRGASTKPHNKGHVHQLICFCLWQPNAVIH